MQNRKDVADALQVNFRWLSYVIFVLRERRNYRSFAIPKRSGGMRQISAPPASILQLQRRAYSFFSPLYEPKPCVHGFVPSRSIVSNARMHLGMRHLVNIDLAGFFPSIHLGRVRGVFLKPPFNFGAEAAELLAQICCHEDGSLPQGGVMSPIVSNLVCRGLDNDLLQFARKYKLRYSRYADDLTFSTSREELTSALIDSTGIPITLGSEIIQIIARHGFAINNAKSTYRTQRRRQEVTGITVNRFPNLQRHFIRQIESAVRSWETYGYDAAQADYLAKHRAKRGGGLSLINVIRGRLSYAKMVRGDNDYLLRRLVRRFNRLALERISIVPLEQATPSKLRNSPRKSDGWNHWISRFKDAVHLVEVESEDGSVACGSAFHIGNGIVATAGHNIVGPSGKQFTRISIWIGDTLAEAHVVGTPYTGTPGNGCIDLGILYIQELKDSASRIPTQLRLPECGEEVIALGFPTIPLRDATLVAHIGTVEALPVTYQYPQRSIQVSFQMGGGLSGGCLLDKSGHVLGIMTENVFLMNALGEAQRPYGQAVPMEYFDDFLYLQAANIRSIAE